MSDKTPQVASSLPVRSPRATAQPTLLSPIHVSPKPHPLANLETADLVRMVQKRTTELGPISIGQPNRGGLLNGVQMPESPLWEVNDGDRSWATQETVDALAAAIGRVAQEHSNTPRLFIGDMSKRRGGYFRPHRSHQSGRDADIGYYYSDGPKWYKRADAENLDRARTWTLIKSLLSQGSVEYLFIDRSVQELIKAHALEVEHDKQWVEQLFSHPGGKAEGVLRHVRGHQTHMHVRFFSDQARETSKRTYSLLARFGKI